MAAIATPGTFSIRQVDSYTIGPSYKARINGLPPEGSWVYTQPNVYIAFISDYR